MKHTVCGGWIEIRTDPQNTAYVVHQGGRKRDTGEDKELQPGEIALRLPGLEQDPAEKDPFAKLEGKTEDKKRASTEASRILELQGRQSRDWDDPYAQSKRLRKTFRTERKGLEKLEANREALKDKMSLGIELVDETEEDRQRAGMVDFGDNPSVAASGVEASRITRTRPMFEQAAEEKSGSRNHGKHKREADQLAQRKVSLRHELTGNTRAVVDPFLNDVGDPQDIWRPGVKRKKPISSGSDAAQNDTTGSSDPPGANVSESDMPEKLPDNMKKVEPAPVLVSYGSDSD